MRQTDKSPLGFYTIGIAALFLAGFFLLVVFGAKSYRDTADGQSHNMQSRALLSYLATSVKTNDNRGAVSVEDTAEGTVLVISDGDTGFALRIYCHEGFLVEDYAAQSSPLRPKNGQKIGQTAQFSVETLPGGVLRMTTAAGQVLLHLRSEEGGP